MTTKTTAIETQVVGLTRILEHRRTWLNNPDNKARKTYNEVVNDTNEIKDQLEELNEELNEQLKLKQQ